MATNGLTVRQAYLFATMHTALYSARAYLNILAPVQFSAPPAMQTRPYLLYTPLIELFLNCVWRDALQWRESCVWWVYTKQTIYWDDFRGGIHKYCLTCEPKFTKYGILDKFYLNFNKHFHFDHWKTRKKFFFLNCIIISDFRSQC